MGRATALRLSALMLSGLLLTACENMAGPSGATAMPPPPMAPRAPPLEDQRTAVAPQAEPAYPRYGDSDDYLCNGAPPGDPRSPAACARLRGQVPAPNNRGTGRYGDSDDYLCNDGAPDDPRAAEACGRLRGTAPQPSPQKSRYGDSDDFVCNHGPPGEIHTVRACLRLRGTSS